MKNEKLADKKLRNKKMEYTSEPFDVREINFSINDYSDDWFEFDVFRNDLYNVIIKFQSENFNKSGLPAIFRAEKSKEDSYVHDNWFAFNIDKRGVGHGHWAAINDAFDKYIHKLWREDKYTLEGIYDCLFQIKDHASIMGLCDELSSLSDESKISKFFWTDKANISDFVAKITGMKKIPAEVKKYFSEQFTADFSSIKHKEMTKTPEKETWYFSGIEIKINGKTILWICDDVMFNRIRTDVY